MKNALANLDLSKRLALSKRYAQARKYAPWALLLVGVPGLGKLRLIRALAMGARATVGLEPVLRILDGLKFGDRTIIDAAPAGTPQPESGKTKIPEQNAPATANGANTPNVVIDKAKAKELVDALRSPEALAALKAFGLEVLATWEASELRRKLQKRTG